MNSWEIWAWLSPALWGLMFLFAVRRGHFLEIPVFISYAIPCILFSLAWVILPPDSRRIDVRPPWSEIAGAIMRVLVTMEAIRLVLLPIQVFHGTHSWRRYGCYLFGISLGLFAGWAGINWLGQVRIGCFAAVLGVIALRVLRYHETLPFARVHIVLMAFWLGSAALASAFHSRRGDWIEMEAMRVQAICLFWWIVLFSRTRHEERYRQIEHRRAA